MEDREYYLQYCAAMALVLRWKRPRGWSLEIETTRGQALRVALLPPWV